MDGLFSRRGGWLIGVAIAIAVFVMVNALVGRVVGVRLDLTQDRLFTLSDGTRSLLSNLNKDVTMTFYYSDELGKRIPQYASFATRIDDLMREMSEASNGRLTIERVNPEPFSEAEDQAVELGLQGVPIDDTGDNIYFGVHAMADDPDESRGIPFFQADRDTFLEYDLTKLIWRTANPELASVGVISGKEVFGNAFAAMGGGPAEPWYLLIQMQDFFDVKRVASAESLLRHMPDMLLIMHPTNLDEEFLYAIDQYLLRGGRAVMLVDPWNETAAGQRLVPGAPTFVPEASDLNRLFERWGIEIPAGQTVGDRNLARAVNAGGEGEVIAAPYISWIEPKDENRNLDDAVMASIRSLLLPTPGSIEVKADAVVSVTPLITTTDDATIVENDRERVPDPLKLLDDYTPTGESYILAARLSGSVPTAFPDGPPKPAPPPQPVSTGENNETVPQEATGQSAPTGPDFLPHLSESETPLNVILIADADMAEDQYWINVRNFFGQRIAQPFMDNGAFLLNSLENLQGSNELLDLRARRNGQRPFERIDALRLDAEAEFRSEEQALQQKLEETEAKLAELQQGPVEGAEAPVSDEQSAAMEAFTGELLQIRKSLRQVNLNLRKDIEELQSTVRFVNITAVPALVIVAAIGIGLYRGRRRARSAQ